MSTTDGIQASTRGFNVGLLVCVALQNNTASAGMTRRNTYVCSDRNNADRLSVIPNGKENR